MKFEDVKKYLLDNEPKIRLSFFVGIFIVMGVSEFLFRFKKPVVNKAKRWINNILLVFVNTMVLRFVFPQAAVGFAKYLESLEWGGLLGLIPNEIVRTVLGVIILDMMIYWQHVIAHIIPHLWRLHKVHHVDMDLDISSGSRFHPLEILFSMVYKYACIAILGANPLSVFLFELLLSTCAMFNHSNVTFPAWMEKYLRWILVTPDMHRIHHSIVGKETNSNYGFNVPIWDRIFGSYIPEPAAGQEKMVIGSTWLCSDPMDENDNTYLWNMLLMPFKSYNKKK